MREVNDWWQLADEAGDEVVMDSATYTELGSALGHANPTHLFGKVVVVQEAQPVPRPVPRNLVELVGPP